MPEIGRQPIRYVDGAARDSQQVHAFADPRQRPVEPAAQRFAPCVGIEAVAGGGKRQSGIAKCSADADEVTGLRRIASHRHLRADEPVHLDRTAQRTPRGVTAHELHAMCLRQVREARAECLQPAFVDRGKRQAEGRPGRLRPHGREIAQVDGEGLVAERLRIDVVKEMHPGDQGVHAHRERTAVGYPQQGAVIPDTQEHVFPARAGVAEIAVNEFELGEGHRGKIPQAGCGGPALTLVRGAVAPPRAPFLPACRERRSRNGAPALRRTPWQAPRPR